MIFEQDTQLVSMTIQIWRNGGHKTPDPDPQPRDVWQCGEERVNTGLEGASTRLYTDSVVQNISIN